MPKSHSKRHFSKAFVITAALLVVVAGAVYGLSRTHKTVASTNSSSQNPQTQPAQIVQTPAQTECTNNTEAKLIIVSVSKRHMWACAAGDVAYDNAVITGDENLAADLTPVGSYKIYAKYTNQTLKGSDQLGSWNDFVYYWMPFLYNQYGTYGFHDATWRSPGDFGNIDPYSSNASHGCVEMPLTAAKWLYDWALIGTPVIVKA